MDELIEGKVAAIIDDKIIVINCGSIDGVEENMRFAIFEIGEKIIDPETREDMGNFELVKPKVEVVHIQEKMSSCAYTKEGNGTLIDLLDIEKDQRKRVKVGDSCREYNSFYERFIERHPLGI